MSLVQCCSADGSIIDPMIIVKASIILERWIVDLPDDYLIHYTESSYSNDETSLDWIQHFEKMTAHKARGGWRLVLLDGYGSHHTHEFLRYAELIRYRPILSHRTLRTSCRSLMWVASSF